MEEAPGMAALEARGMEDAPGKLLLSDTLRQTTAALARLDTTALERLLTRLDAAQAGTLEVEPEPVAAIRANHQLLGAVLESTRKNMTVLERLQEPELLDRSDRHDLRERPELLGNPENRREAGRLRPWGR
jgi:hypothetical protein